MNFSLFSVYLLTASATVSAPGPGVLMTLMKSIQYGFRGAIWTVLGTASGTVVMAGISATGLGLLLANSPTLYDGLRILGGFYMVWLGIKNWRVKTVSLETAIRSKAHSHPVKHEDGTMIRPFAFYMEGIGLQMTNPMLIMFFVSLFPQFIDEELDFWPQFVILEATYFFLVVLIHSGYSIATSKFRGFLASEKASKFIYRIGGSIFIILALKVFSQVLL